METYSRDKIIICTHTRKFSKSIFQRCIHLCALILFKSGNRNCAENATCQLKVPSGLEACSLPSPGAGVLLYVSNIGMCQ